MISGKLIAIGGAEHRVRHTGHPRLMESEALHYLENGILSRIVKEAGGSSCRIEIITTASSSPEQRGNEYFSSFRQLGCSHVGVISIRHRKEITDQFLRRLQRCDCVLFTGGTQKRLGTTYLKTSLLELLRKRYQSEGLLVAGTSAGAMAFGKIMIYKGTPNFTHLTGKVKTQPGFDLISTLIFDSHFEKTGRFGRLAQVIALNEGCTGIGLYEDTGVIITGGNTLEVIGTRWAAVIDRSQISTNISNIMDHQTVPSIHNIRTFLCAEGDQIVFRKTGMDLKRVDLVRNSKNRLPIVD